MKNTHTKLKKKIKYKLKNSQKSNKIERRRLFTIFVQVAVVPGGGSSRPPRWKPTVMGSGGGPSQDHCHSDLATVTVCDSVRQSATGCDSVRHCVTVCDIV